MDHPGGAAAGSADMGGGVLPDIARAVVDARPLVLIQSPLNGEYVEVGEGVAVQAVARVGEGVQRMQVWVDDALVAEKVVSKDEINSPMVIITNWVPPMAGRHVVSVRAISGNGVSGQSTVFVMAEEQAAVRHVVEEGETLEVIAASYGVEEEAISEVNEQLGGSNPQAGDELEVPVAGRGYSPPFDSWGDEVNPATDDGAGGIGPDGGAGESDDVPLTAAPEPGSPESMDILWFDELFQPPTDPVELVIEVQALQTREAYESLHCYVSLAGSTPTWVPDADYDQSTDETFESRADGSEWNVARYLSDPESTTITWDRNTPVPLDISCVGVMGGGLNSMDLGRVLDEVTPEQWGIPQVSRSSGGESQFNLAYLVTYPSKGLDPTMTAPWNVRLHEGSHTLSWSYLEDVAGSPAVDGFAIFLNDQLQFTVDGRTREVEIPPQWFEVACNNTHRFTVVAFFYSYPDGDYSNPSDPAVLPGGEPGSEACPLSVTITFQVLNVGNLGNPMPITAYFFANEQRLTLDGFNGVLVPEVDVYGIPRPEVYVNEETTPPTLGLEDDHGYFIGSLFEATLSRFGSLVLELPYDDPENPYDSLQLGFEIYGPDHRLLCGGDLAVSAEDAREGIIGDIFNEYPREGNPSLCVVTLNISPIIEGASEVPLPNLVVEGITYDRDTGYHVLHLRNTGQADWVDKDLVIEATTREGELIDRYTFRNATLEVNEQAELLDQRFNWEPVLSACVFLDPDNLVDEEIDRLERADFISRGRYCPLMPDLSITDVQFNRAANELNLNILNDGERTGIESMDEGIIQNRDLLLRIESESGSTIEQTIENFSLDAYGSIVVPWPLNETEREDLAGGYTVTVNADESIYEADTTNNTYDVEGSTMLKIAWRQAGAWFCSTARPWWGNLHNHWYFDFSAGLSAGGATDVIASWESADLEIAVDERLESWCTTEYTTDWFEVGADETLVISMDATMQMAGKRDRNSDGGSEILNAANGFGGVTVIPMDMDPEYYNHYVFTNDISHAEACGVGVGENYRDPYDWAAGMHRWGPYYMHDTYGSGSEDRDPCFWSSTFMIYQAEEP